MTKKLNALLLNLNYQNKVTNENYPLNLANHM